MCISVINKINRVITLTLLFNSIVHRVTKLVLVHGGVNLPPTFLTTTNAIYFKYYTLIN